MKRYLALQQIVEYGSFSRAAEAMGYTQSALSQMIASLEDELHMRLLNRYRSSVRLTAEGKELYPSVQALITSYQAAMNKAGEIAGLETGVIRMGVLGSISVHWLPTLIRDFKARYPRVEFVIHQGDHSSIEEWIRTGQVDFGFVNPKAVVGLQCEVLKQGQMMAILPKGHPLAAQDTVPLAELAREPFILLEEGHYYEPLEAFKAVGLRPDVRYTIHDDYTIMTMVEAGLGVSILAELILRRTSYDIAIRPTDPPVYRTVSIAYRNRGTLPSASRVFIQQLKEQLPHLP